MAKKYILQRYIKNIISFYIKENNKNEKIKRGKFIAYFLNKYTVLNIIRYYPTFEFIIFLKFSGSSEMKFLPFKYLYFPSKQLKVRE